MGTDCPAGTAWTARIGVPQRHPPSSRFPMEFTATRGPGVCMAADSVTTHMRKSELSDSLNA
jgi:hypothetical protein